jgi:hypothetical protein
MKKTLLALAAVATLAVGSVGDAYAQHRYHHHHHGAGLGAVLGGLAAGAIIGGAIATTRPAYSGYAVAPGYAHYPAYAEPVPVACPGGYWARRPRFDAYGNLVGYSRPRFFCP